MQTVISAISGNWCSLKIQENTLSHILKLELESNNNTIFRIMSWSILIYPTQKEW